MRRGLRLTCDAEKMLLLLVVKDLDRDTATFGCAEILGPIAESWHPHLLNLTSNTTSILRRRQTSSTADSHIAQYRRDAVKQTHIRTSSPNQRRSMRLEP